MKVSALIAATLLVVSVSVQANEATAPAAPATAPAAKATKGATKTTTTTTTTTTAAADHQDCTTLKGKAKTTCEAHEKTAHTGSETHAH